MEEQCPEGEKPLATLFPSLHDSDCEITSKYSRNYNCLAWAMHDTSRKWYPCPSYYWPKGLKYDDAAETLTGYLQSEKGFIACIDEKLEEGFEKIAIFAQGWSWEHVARQLSSGKWTSKIGNREDISHNSPNDLEGDEYGHVICYMKRSLK